MGYERDVLNLEPTPNVMPPKGGWLVDAKVKLQEHFDERHANFPVYDRSVVVGR